MKKLLVISHDASRSGAPILLLNILKAYKEAHPEVVIDIIVRRNGPLIQEFVKVGDRVLVLNNNKILPASAFSEFKRKSKFKVLTSFSNKRLPDLAVKHFTAKDYDLVLSNTISNGAILRALQPVRCKVLTYVHELESAIRAWTNSATLAYTLKYTDHFLVPSKAVGENLIKNHNISSSQIDLLYYYIPEPFALPDKDVMNNLIPNSGNEVLVGAIGTLEWRKGADLFIQVALLLKKRKTPEKIKFIWIGADKKSEVYSHIKHDIQLAGLSKDVIIVDKVNNPLDYLSVLDLFLMTSREDPYPLVVLEAAMLRKTIICFENAGGASEFLSENNGIVVPYLDVSAMAESIITLVENKKQIILYGEKARKKYGQLHSKEHALKRFEAIVERFSLK